MTATLPVHLNRGSLGAVDVESAFEAEGTFDVVLQNHGEGVHVHLNLDDALSSVASIEATNHYVEAGDRRPVRVTVDGRGSISGQLKVVTKYGAEERLVDVSLVEPGDVSDPVAVDESLAEPTPRETSGGRLDGLAEGVPLPVIALAVGAAAVAVAIGLLVDDPVVLAGAGLVVLAGLVAVGMVLRE